jgi:hypothetical protein
MINEMSTYRSLCYCLPGFRLMAYCLWGLATLSFTSQLVADESTQPVEKITYADHVQPILRAHCFSCHHQGDKKGGLALDTYAALVEGGGSGEIVYDDGDPDASRLWQLVNHDDTPEMPPNQDKLAAEKLDVIRQWIVGGILENSGSKAKQKKKNALAFAAGGSGRPEGGGAMPESVPQQTPVVSSRAAAITAIAASPWAPLVAIAGQQQIVLYHADTHELLGILPFAEGIAQSLRFSRDGAYLIAAGGDHSVLGMVAVYDVKTGARVATVGDDLDIVFDGDVNDTMTRIATGGPQKMLRIYDAADGSRLFDLKKHTDWIYTVAYSPDGVLIASGDRAGGLCVWEAETGQLYLTLTDHKDAIHSVAWRDDSNVLASASADGTVKLWDMHQGTAIKSIAAHGGGVTDVAFDHQARLLTAGKDKLVKLWDAAGNHLRDFPPMSEQVLEAAITHDGSRAVYGDWTGAVLSALTEDPANQQPLAANPPPATERIVAVKAELDQLLADIQPLEQAYLAANQAVAEAQQPIDAINAQISAAKEAALTADAAAQAALAEAATIDHTLPALTGASRDALDSVIAGRVNLQSDPSQAEAVATAEQQLAEQLLEIANQRRARLAAEAAAKAHAELANSKRAAAEALAAQLPPLQQTLQTASDAAAQAKAAHEAVAKRLASLQSRHQQLAQVIAP